MKYGRIILLALLLASALPATAQIFRRTADGGDSIQSNVSFVDAELHEMQRQIQYRMGDSLCVLLPEEGVTGVNVQKKTFLNVRVQLPDGRVERMFAHRVYTSGSMPVLFKIYDEHNEPSTYVQIQGGLVVPVKEPIDPNDALHRELVRLNDSLGGDEQTAHFVSELRPLPRKMSEAKRLMERQNHNLITRVRWGVSVGMMNNTLSAKAIKISDTDGEKVCPLDAVTQMQPWVSVFADIPSGSGMSMHPELTFRKASLHQQATWRYLTPREVAYNCTMIELPMMLRYSAIQLRGKCLPYAEIGVHFGYMLCNEQQSRDEVLDDGYLSGYTLNTETGDAITFQPAAGIGIEYRYSERYAAFLGARYVLTPEYHTGNSLNLSQKAWLVSLSFTL